ncbi:MAG: SGNH/GDSL hydrolase family protein [Pseudolabrys sp.]
MIGVVCGLALEVAIRLYARATVFTLEDWRGAGGTILQGAGVYHPQLGWTQASNLKGPGFNTLDHGIRKNSKAEEKLDQGAILAVGDSFTAGSEVVDEDTWPAQLERLIGRRVINAGVGGYGVDQAVLNAERLLPELVPKLVLVGIYEDDIDRSGYKIYNAPKPYFVKEDGKWVHRHSPVPARRRPVQESIYKTILSRSLAASIFFNKVARDWWYESKDAQYVRSGANSTEVSCYMLGRLQERLKAAGIPGIVVVQYNGRHYAIRRPVDPHVTGTIQCAKELGYAVVDEHPRIAAIREQSLDEVKKLYVMHPNEAYGHMSPAGNKLIAGMIAEKITQMPSLSAVIGR